MEWNDLLNALNVMILFPSNNLPINTLKSDKNRSTFNIQQFVFQWTCVPIHPVHLFCPFSHPCLQFRSVSTAGHGPKRTSAGPGNPKYGDYPF